MEKLKVCPICSNNYKHYKDCIDYTVSYETFEIVNCVKCGFKFTNPRPTANEIDKFYDSPAYISHSNSKKGVVNKIYQFIRKISLTKKLNIVASLNPINKNILDIGCGTGEFLNRISINGYGATGIEPNIKAREKAIKNYNLNILPEEGISSLPKNNYGIISMWHVLEHVHNLTDRVQAIQGLLCENGYAIIAVPNYTSWDAHHYKQFWASYDVPRHLYHFSPEVIKTIFKNTGLMHIQSLPLIFDSYYVSLLSSKYKKDKFPILNSILNGFRSNLNAKKDPERYSSVIYIFHKKS